MMKKVIIAILIFLMMLFVNVFAVDSYGGYKIPVDIDVNGSFIK